MIYCTLFHDTFAHFSSALSLEQVQTAFTLQGVTYGPPGSSKYLVKGRYTMYGFVYDNIQFLQWFEKETLTSIVFQRII